MGQRFSQDRVKSGKIDQCFCFGFNPPFANGSDNHNGFQTKKSNNDPMGTPLPETPIFQRKRRQQVQQVLQQENKQRYLNVKLIPPQSGKVRPGLEKETSSQYLKLNGGGSFEEDISKSDDSTHIYEGPDCELYLQEKYQLLEVLGVGSTSTVHRCRNKITGLECACKIINCQFIEDRFAGMMTQFQTEIQALKSLSHESIIKLYDVYMTDEKIYIIMELMEGGELFDYVVQKGTLTEEEASKIVRKVTSAVAYMHSMNFIHRDLKPENLLLKEAPKTPYDEIDVKIIDFGLSKIMEEPVARTFLGTRGYLSPEQLSRREYTKAVDSWALGVIVFVLLCGCLPFDDDSATITNEEVVQLKFQLRYPRWAKNLSASAKDLLSHLLTIDPVQRYSAEQALLHPWVQGKTAPRDNLLASPGRIKKSPAIRTSGTTTHRPNGKAANTPPTPTVIVRKTSI